MKNQQDREPREEVQTVTEKRRGGTIVMGETKQMGRMHELHRILKEAAKAYYQESSEIMSNYEYDALYDELVALEKETRKFQIYQSCRNSKLGRRML